MNDTGRTMLAALFAATLCVSTRAAPERHRQIRTATANGIQWTFAVERGGAVITSGEKKPAIEPLTEGDVVIPTMLGGFSVREIGDYAFYGCGAMSSVKIPNGIKRIGNEAFRECHAIEALEIPPTVSEIGWGAFSRMRTVQTVRILGKVPVLSGHVFAECGQLTTVDIGPGVERVIGHLCLGSGKIQRIVFPDTLKIIDSSMYSNGPFSGCRSLQEVIFLGPPPEIKNFGANLNGKVRYTAKYKNEWSRWLKAKAIEGMEVSNADLPKRDRPAEQDEVREPPRPRTLIRQRPDEPPGADPGQSLGESVNVVPEPRGDVPAEKKESAPGSHVVAARAEPQVLDTSALTNAWNEAGISAWRCGVAFKDFGKAVADANAAAVAQRAKLDTTARVYLKQQMEKAQAEGDLDKVLVFKTALESARHGEIAGNDEAIVKLRESYARQLVLADKAHLEAGLAAARAFSGTLDGQKTETTKKGDIDEAKKIAAFQKKVEDWAKSIQAQAASAQSAARTSF